MSMERRCPWCGERAISRKEAFRANATFSRDLRYNFEQVYHCPRCTKPIKLFSNQEKLILILAWPTLILLALLILQGKLFPLLCEMLHITTSSTLDVIWWISIALLIIAVVVFVSSLFFGSFYRLQPRHDKPRLYVASFVPVQLIIEAERRIPLLCEKVLVVQLPLTPAQIYKKTSERHRELTAFFEPSARPTAKGKYAYDVGFILGNEINLDHIAVGMPITVVLRDGETTVDATVRVVRR